MGSGGAYVSHSTDVQAQQIFAGQRPADDLAAWGYEPESNWGTLFSEGGATQVPAEQGRYHDHYAAFAQAVQTGSQPPVTAAHGTDVMRVLDAARKSAAEGRSIDL